MNLRRIKLRIEDAKRELERLERVTANSEIADASRFTILSSVETIEADMTSIRKAIDTE